MDRQTPRKRLVLLLSLIVLSLAAVVAIGCGDDDSSSSTGSSTDSGSTDSGASSGGEKVEKKTITYVEPAAVDEVTNRNVTQMKEAGAALGWDVKFSNLQGDFTKVGPAIEAGVNSGTDAVVIGSTDAKLVRKALTAAKQADIPAIVIGGGVTEDPLYVAQYTEDEPEMGKLITEQMVKDLGGKGDVAAIEISQLSSGTLRQEARDEVMRNTDVKLVDKADGDLADPIQGTKKIASAMIAKNPDLAAMWLVYDYMMAPTTEVLKAAGNDKTLVYSWFAGPDNVRLLKSNPNVKGLVENNFDHTALIALDQLANHFANDADIDPEALAKCPLKYEVIEKDNAPPAGELTWPIPENRAPFVENWDAGKYGEGADCG